MKNLYLRGRYWFENIRTILILNFIVKISLVLAQVGPVIPDVGVNRCFLSFLASEYFFYLPIFLILCFNATLFSVTIVNLVRGNKSNKLAREGRVRTTPHRSISTNVSLFLLIDGLGISKPRFGKDIYTREDALELLKGFDPVVLSTDKQISWLVLATSI